MMQKWRKFKKRLQPFILFNFLASMIVPFIIITFYPNLKLSFYHGDPLDFFFNYVFISGGLLAVLADWQINLTSHCYDHGSLSSTNHFLFTSDQRTDYVNNPTYSFMPGNNHYTSPFSNISSIGISKSPFDS